MELIINLLQPVFGEHIDWKQVMLIAMSPVFLLAFAVECWLARSRPALRKQIAAAEVMSNLTLGGAYQVFELVVFTLFVSASLEWVHAHRLFDMPVNVWTIVPLFLGVEFLYYWFHRASHRIRWFWSAHVVHHSSEQMNFTTAMRQSMLYPLTGYWIFFLPLVVLGVSPTLVFLMYGANLAFQYFVHTEAIGRLHPWIEFVFNTPSHHRAHHGRNPQYIDKNYGGVLIIFDRMFGTFEPEVERVEYGIPRQIHSRNVLLLNLHEFIDMWRDVLRPGPLWQRVKHLWAPPEWTREAAGHPEPGNRGRPPEPGRGS